MGWFTPYLECKKPFSKAKTARKMPCFYRRFTLIGKNIPMAVRFFRVILFCIPLLLIASERPIVAESAKLEQISRFSGKPLPRFESLRYSAVHGRQGPTLDHPILWRYERKGMPMLVIRETHGWRRVRDIDGDEVWVQARMLSEARTAIFISASTLHRKPDANSSAQAKIVAGVVAELETCDGNWCRVKIQRKSGWVERQDLWGTETATGSV